MSLMLHKQWESVTTECRWLILTFLSHNLFIINVGLDLLRSVIGIKCRQYCKPFHGIYWIFLIVLISEIFHTVLSEVLDLFLPLRSVHSRRSNRPTPWFSDDIRQLITSKNKTKCQADRSSNLDDRHYFQQLKNKLKTSIRQAKVDYLQMLMQRSRSNLAHAADVWSHVSVVFGRNTQSHIAPMDSPALNSINDHFQTVAISSDHKSAASLSFNWK